MITDIFRSHPEYRDMTQAEEMACLHEPHRHGRLLYYGTPSGWLAFTWTRPTTGASIGKLASGKVDTDLWLDHTGDMRFASWIVDVAATKGVSGREIGKFLRWVVVAENITDEGRKVLFHRNGGISAGRIGFLTARSG